MPYTHEKKCCSERDNRTVVENARAMMYAHETIPNSLWAEMVNTASFILNLFDRYSIPDMTPVELWTGNKPELKNLRIIGCTCSTYSCTCSKTQTERYGEKGYKRNSYRL